MLTLSTLFHLYERARHAARYTTLMVLGSPVVIFLFWCVGIACTLVLWYFNLLPMPDTTTTTTAHVPKPPPSLLHQTETMVVPALLIGLVCVFAVLYLFAIVVKVRDNDSAGLLLMTQFAGVCVASYVLQWLLMPTLSALFSVALGYCDDSFYEAVVGCRNFTAACVCVSRGTIPLVVLIGLVLLAIILLFAVVATNTCERKEKSEIV
jgi:uncharacterized membrane protein